MHQRPLWQGLSTQQSFWNCQPQGSYLLYFLLQKYRLVSELLQHICIFFVISLVIIVYVFVFQNIIIEGRNFYVFTIFRVSQLVFVPLKRLLYLEFSVQNFLLPTANLLIIPGTLFCLSPVMVSIIPHGADDFHLLKHDLKLLFFSYSDATMTPGFDQKVKKNFFAYLYLHLTLPPSDRMMD